MPIPLKVLYYPASGLDNVYPGLIAKMIYEMKFSQEVLLSVGSLSSTDLEHGHAGEYRLIMPFFDDNSKKWTLDRLSENELFIEAEFSLNDFRFFIVKNPVFDKKTNTGVLRISNNHSYTKKEILVVRAQSNQNKIGCIRDVLSIMDSFKVKIIKMETWNFLLDCYFETEYNPSNALPFSMAWDRILDKFPSSRIIGKIY